MLRPIYQATDAELYNCTNEVEDELYSIQLYFNDTNHYDECIARIGNRFNVQAEGRTVHHQQVTYKVTVAGLTRGEDNDQHGFRSYHFNNNYIRVYWNNNQKRVIFSTE
jgi:hypothetical protein